MDHSQKHEKGKHNNALFWVSLTALVGLVASYFIFPAFEDGVNEAFDVITSEDEDRIRTWVKHFGLLGPVVLILAMIAQMFLFIIPNLLLFIIAILCYGPIWGSLICLTGVYASSSLGFVIGRRLGPRAIDRFVSETAQEKISLFVRRYGAKAIAIARLSSLASDGLGFAAGILEMEYKKFITATIAGITPVILLIAIFGKNGKVEKSLLWIAAISLVILVVYIILDKKKRQSELNRTSR